MKVPLVDCSSRMVASPVSLTVTVACRRDTFSYRKKAAATRDSPGSRPSTSDVPAGTSTFPVGNDSRSTTGEIGPEDRGSGPLQAGQASIDRSGMAAPQRGQVAGASDEAVAPSR